MKITPRLDVLAGLVPTSDTMADIGTDHAYIPIRLCSGRKVKRAIASDIHEGPLQKAQKHIYEENLEDCIQTRLGSGLSVLRPGEADGAVIAGMGGTLICDILEAEPDICCAFRWLVLQPMTHAADLRRWLALHGWRIQKEKFALEDTKLYEMFLCVQGQMNFPSPLWEEIGMEHWRDGDALIELHLQRLINKRTAILNGISAGNKSGKNPEKRERALREKKELEELLWEYRQKKSSNS